MSAFLERSRPGFTFTEMVVSIGILGIMAMLIAIALNPSKHLATMLSTVVVVPAG